MQVLACVRGCDVLKPTLDAAPELLALSATEGKTCNPMAANIDADEILRMDLESVAIMLLQTFGAKMVAVTDGKRGCGFAVDVNGGVSASVGGHLGIKQIDSTGAGDAFFGGLIAGIFRCLGLKFRVQNFSTWTHPAV